MKSILLFAIVLSGSASGLRSTVQLPQHGATAENAGEEAGPCVMCHEDCPTGEHVAVNGGFTLPLNWFRNGGAHLYGQCVEGTCATKHGPQTCGEGALTLNEVSSLDEDVHRGDVTAIKRVVASHTSSVRVNAGRAALQVIDCHGATYAHFPVEPSLLARLAA